MNSGASSQVLPGFDPSPSDLVGVVFFLFYLCVSLYKIGIMTMPASLIAKIVTQEEVLNTVTKGS